jgi:glycosyltransferase involved in cell wall biosynthesis
MNLLGALSRAAVGASKTSIGQSWVHVCNGLDSRRDGGMVPSILGMTGGLAEQGGDVRIVTPTPSRIESRRIPRGVRLEGPEADLERAVRWADIVHIHGLWQGHTRRAAAEARHHRIPHLIAAHGMADPWAVRQKRWKKWLYSLLIENRNLRGCSCLHALTRPEVDYLREFAPKAPVAWVPNGVDLSVLDRLPPRAEFEVDHPEIRDKFVLLFFSRVHKKKGLDLLAPALAKVAQDHPEIHLLMAGIDDGALAPFLAVADSLGLKKRITYVGHVDGEEARKVWSAADAFILPSYSEGFSMSVLEALGCGLPSIITTACNFPELARENAGICVPPTLDGIVQGLRDLLEMSGDELERIGSRGRLLVEQSYTWERQAEQLAKVYGWLAGGGDRPQAVMTSNC